MVLSWRLVIRSERYTRACVALGGALLEASGVDKGCARYHPSHHCDVDFPPATHQGFRHFGLCRSTPVSSHSRASPSCVAPNHNRRAGSLTRPTDNSGSGIQCGRRCAGQPVAPMAQASNIDTPREHL
jgi:hypothetical protein